jgi:hypothetical protein
VLRFGQINGLGFRYSVHMRDAEVLRSDIILRLWELAPLILMMSEIDASSHRLSLDRPEDVSTITEVTMGIGLHQDGTIAVYGATQRTATRLGSFLVDPILTAKAKPKRKALAG